MTAAEHEPRLKHFPITLLPTVMGLAGLAVVYLKFQHFFAVDIPVGQGLLFAVSAWFVLVMGLYLAKFVRYPVQVKKDFRHPIRVNFFPAISISLLLLSIGYLESGFPGPARVLWLVATPLHLVFLLVIMNGWFHNTYHLNSFNPAWFIPVVGPLLIPVAGVGFADPEVSWFFFATGIIHWIVLLAVLLHRVFFHDPMPRKLLPTLCILLAPPAVGFIAYVKLISGIDPFARVLFHFGVFTALLLLTMIGVFRRTPFFVSWWAYTFPLDAFTISLYLMHKLTEGALFKQAALVMTVVTTLVILVVLVRTVRVALRGDICVPED